MRYRVFTGVLIVIILSIIGGCFFYNYKCESLGGEWIKSVYSFDIVGKCIDQNYKIIPVLR